MGCRNCRQAEDRSGTHLFRVFLESVFPVFLREEFIIGEECEELLDVASFDDLAKADIPGIGCWNHYENVVRTYPEEIKPLKPTLD